MPNEVMEISSVVTQNGNGLPKNFNNLPEKRQKNIILSELADAQSEICNIVESEEDAKSEVKKITTLLKTSKEFKRIKELKAQSKQSKQRVSQLLSERNGILKIAAKMGLDLKEELKKLKAIN